MKKMKAIVKTSPGKGLELQSVDVPSCGTNDVLIKVHKTAVCGTDLHIYNWDEWAQRAIRTPLIIGHEFTGEIVEMGPGVTSYSIGDRVMGEGHLTCGICRNCRAGKRHLCHRTVAIGIHRDGAFAEYLVLPEFNVFPVHPNIPSEIATVFDPLGNAAHCVLTYDMVAEDVLITGAGPVGLMAVSICRFVGARHIVITDINEYIRDVDDGLEFLVLFRQLLGKVRERLLVSLSLEQVQQSILRMKLSSIEVNRQSGVEEGIVPKQVIKIFRYEMIVLKYCIVRFKNCQGSIAII